jgi:hypothetical protein
LPVLGGFQWPLALSFLFVVGFGVWAAWKLFRPDASPDLKTRIWVDATLFWGLFGMVLGAMGSVLGLVRALQGFEAAGRFASPLVARGFVMLTLSGILGLSILGVAALLWFFLQLRWRLLQAAREDTPV